MAQDDGGPAYPRVVHTYISGGQEWSEGMSLRDYFAGQALPAVLEGSHRFWKLREPR